MTKRIAVLSLVLCGLLGIAAWQGNPYLSTPTLVAPIITTGLTASGSAANDFSGSTGAFKTSSGANTLSGAVTIPVAGSGLTMGVAGSALGQILFANLTSGSITLTPPSGALGTPVNTLPANTGGLPTVYDCGSTGTGNQTCAPAAVNGQFHEYYGHSTLSSNAATITFPITFTSTTTFECVANDITTRANPVQMIPASASTATITNTTGASDVIQWHCGGQ